ncbi:hypothetical protein Tco_0386031 [Tanacetum coccineum]
MNVFVRISFNFTIELVSYDESQVVTFNGEFVCGFENGDCGTGSQNDNTVGIPHGFIIQFLNDEGYNGGFEEGDIEKAFVAMKENYKAWVCGFATLAIGADVPINQTAKDASLPTSGATSLRDNLRGRNQVVMLNVEEHLPHLSASVLLAQHRNKAISR